MRLDALIDTLKEFADEFGDHLHVTVNGEFVNFEPYIDTLHQTELYVLELGLEK